MTIGTILLILAISIAIVSIAVGIDVFTAYRREKKAEKEYAESVRLLELARQTESTIALKVIIPHERKQPTGKHRLAA